MKTESKSTTSLVHAWWVVVLLFTMVSATGCSWFLPPQPQQPETVQEFMRQDRPGNGILGK
ncbi:MAG: hypothetical protein MPJ50_05450 [Pirellulales bacterium]|nr:hypothetical protein [Pirellulales bacterium]